jgi:hypothetical protein
MWLQGALGIQDGEYDQSESLQRYKRTWLLESSEEAKERYWIYEMMLPVLSS